MENRNMLMNLVNRHKNIDPKTYHNALQLLKIYSEVVWNNVEEYSDVVCESSEVYGLNSYKGLEIMTEFGEEEKAIELKQRLMNIAENKLMIDIIEKALLHVKAYKHGGKIYYNIIKNNFLVENDYSECEILDILNMSRSTYYRKRKEAINLFGISLWGFIIPKTLKILHKTTTRKTKMVLN